MEHETKKPEVQTPAQSTTLTIPIAIIISGVLIAGAVYLGTSKGANTVAVNNQQPQQVAQQTGDLEKMKADSEALSASLSKVGEAMQKEAQNAQPADAAEAPKEETPLDETIRDAETQ